MTTTVIDSLTGTEINLGQSDVHPDRVRVTIYSKQAVTVQSVIQDLADEYGCVEFTVPVRCADGKWASIGTVWRACSV